ncbi:prenyltransferase/squalene oxidase repeat-containing protein [Micromonospora sp. DT231]|uniref:prenyltransferase/squalene oxidase repeat-containing protein n=1 Tax=Micromonospora sp. DT231 TaxID=3416526 RepID=UPI003CF46C4E
MPDYSPWLAVNALGSDPGAYELLTAAHKDLTTQTALLDERPAALRVLSATTEFRDGVGHELVVRVEAMGQPTEVRIAEKIVRATTTGDGAHGVTPLVLVAYALQKDPFGSGWRPRRVGHAEPPSVEAMEYYARLDRLTDSSTQVERQLEAGRDVVVIGEHGCGKSALVANIADKRRADDGVVWLNLADPADGPESIVLALLEQERSRTGRYLVVLENLHANPLVLNELFDCVTRLRSDFGLEVQVLATSYKVAGPNLAGGEPTRELRQVLAEGRPLVGQLLVDSGIDEAHWPTIRRLAQDDVHLALTAIDLYGQRGAVPTEADLEAYYTRQVTSDDQREVLYRVACLGVLELQMAAREAGPLRQALERLRDDGLIYQVDGAYLIGSRRRAQLVMNHARRHWNADSRWKSPQHNVWLHLQRGGERLMKATLSRLDQLVSPDAARTDTLHLLSTWETLIRLGRTMRKRSTVDPSWGDNSGAAVFAASALNQLNHVDSWWTIAGVVRARWSYEAPDHGLPEPTGDVTADYQDFVKIQQSMAKEDAILGAAPHLAGMRADDLDTGLMYRNWVLGLLLGFEGSAPAVHQDQERIDRLIEVAREAQDEDGYFYPARVPWVTARVILGLCQANLRMDHPVVRDACNWLLRQVSEGGSFDNWWRSGTGTWNRDEATTAMCLSALLRAGVPMRPEMETAHAWLMGREGEWTTRGREIDMAQALESTLLCTGAANGTREHLKTLFQRIVTEQRSPTLLSTAPEERLRIPFVAAQLADIVWRIVQLESLKLFGDVINQGRLEPSEPTEVPVVPHTVASSSAGATLSGPQLRAWQRGCEQIEGTIRERLAKRDGPMRTPAVEKVLTEQRAYRAQVNELTSRLDEHADRELLEQIDALGRLVCGVAWPDLPWPDAGSDPTS